MSASLFKPRGLPARHAAHMNRFLRYFTFPLLFVGANAAIILLIGRGAPYWQPILILIGAAAFMFIVERRIPYVDDWNRSHDDAMTDAIHATFNTLLSHAGVFALPLLATHTPFKGAWPMHWPFW